MAEVSRSWRGTMRSFLTSYQSESAQNTVSFFSFAVLNHFRSTVSTHVSENTAYAKQIFQMDASYSQRRSCSM